MHAIAVYSRDVVRGNEGIPLTNSPITPIKRVKIYSSWQETVRGRPLSSRVPLRIHRSPVYPKELANAP
jgi:hypothetical protein